MEELEEKFGEFDTELELVPKLIIKADFLSHPVYNIYSPSE